jgi:transposase
VAQRGLAGTEKKSRRDRRSLIFLDESGFYLLPGAVRTYSPCGDTPCLEVKQTRDHLSVLGGITPEGRLFTRIQRRTIHGGDCVSFLKRVRSQLGPKLLVIWDGSPMHHGDEVAWYLAERPSGMVQVEQLPGYAPDLNPQEGVWEHLKHVELRNCCFADLEALGCGLTRAIARLRHKVALIRSFFLGAGLNL